MLFYRFLSNSIVILLILLHLCCLRKLRCRNNLTLDTLNTLAHFRHLSCYIIGYAALRLKYFYLTSLQFLEFGTVANLAFGKGLIHDASHSESSYLSSLFNSWHLYYVESCHIHHNSVSFYYGHLKQDW